MVATERRHPTTGVTFWLRNDLEDPMMHGLSRAGMCSQLREESIYKAAVTTQRPPDDWLQGNQPVAERLNVRRELRELRSDPMAPYLRKLARANTVPPIADEVALYEEGYEFFYQSFARFLPELSVAYRWRMGPYFALKYGEKYTASDRRLADQFNPIKRFFYYDFWNCLLHTRILCDRAISLTRHFLKGPELPSFRSFANHKKFFVQGRSVGPQFAEYERKIVGDTDWFDVPLKYVRDKYLVHVATEHMRSFGYAESGDLQLILTIPVHPNAHEPLKKTRHVTVSVRRLARDMQGFLQWLAAYGSRWLNTAA
jgi:hypothetical protein